MKKHPGRVYLIGAGPGDPGLITVKGKQILERSSVIVYDALVNESIIASLPLSIRRIFVGKRGGETSTPQKQINQILVREAKKGNMVARLKGGDPLMLGRGSEEMEFLREQGIDYEIVPGISSALSAPAWAGIPVTHRSLSRSVAIATGHLQAGESIDALVLPRADTLVFLMAMQNIDIIVERLIASGSWSKKTPAAIVRNGTLPDQQAIVGTLATISALKNRHRITAPAVLVVGQTAAFAKTLCWYKRPPLAGVRVVVLRTPEQSDDLVQSLYTKGATVVPWPIISIQPRLGALKKLTAAFLKPFDILIFTSPNGVRLFMDALLSRGIDARHFAGKKIYALGASTAGVIRNYGLLVDGVPKKFVAEGVLGLLPKNLTGQKILIPRAAIARDVLPERLTDRGGAVTVFAVYDTVKNSDDHTPVEQGDYVFFTSSSTAEAYFANKHCKDIAITACCIGDITAATVRSYYKGPICVAPNATMTALVETLEKSVLSASGKKGKTHDRD